MPGELKSTLTSVMLLVLLFPIAASAQKQPDNAAAQIAKALSQSKQSGVVVFDIVGSNSKMDPLGSKLADDLQAGLTNANSSIRFIDRSNVKAIFARERLEPHNLLDPGVAAWLTAKLKANAMVVGRFSVDITGVISESIGSYRSDGHAILGLAVTLPLTSEFKQLIPENLKDDVLKVEPMTADPNSDAWKEAVTNGFSSPKCRSCPSPQFPDEASVAGAAGTVLLNVIVNVDGHAEDVRVVRALPYGLTLNAINAVEKWTFVPATRPDGSSVAVRQAIEVTYHLGSRP